MTLVIRHMLFHYGLIGMMQWLCMSKRRQPLTMDMMSLVLACMIQRPERIMMLWRRMDLIWKC